MDTAVVFTSKLGATRRTAEHIAKALDADLIDLKKGAGPLAHYDTIILGSGIYFGKMPKGIRKFISERKQELNGKRVALFVCCMYTGEEAEKQLAAAAELTGPLVSAAYISGKKKKEDVDTDAVDAFIRSLE
ncbi:MAG: flavodoxin domain-containing protein [Methanomassiliicoccaceae archaeon]|nr:flavodoxin domain-containing protein [Methanomassiliicoccaceae archaeon]